MKIRYENDMADIEVFALRHHETSRTARRAHLAIQWLFPLLILVFGVMEWRAHDPPIDWIALVLALVGAGVFVLVYPGIARWAVRRTTRSMMTEQGSAAVLCEHTLTIEADGLRERTLLGESLVRWPAVERLDRTSDHALVFVGPATAHVIPRNRLLEGDFDAFLAELEWRKAESRHGAPAGAQDESA